MNTELNQFMQTESFSEIQEILQFLLEECSLDEAPALEEVAQWQQILQQRGGKFIQLATLCQKFVQEVV